MNNISDETQQKEVYKDEKTQQELNTPLAGSGVVQKNQEFLDLVLKLIKDGKIDLYKPETLINHEVYDKLDEAKQGKVDLEAMNLLSAVREIKGLYDAEYQDTYQMQNLVDRVRNTKERLEEEGGNLFII
jgi:hypothetical protein